MSNPFQSPYFRAREFMAEHEPEIKQRSGWATFHRCFGHIGLTLAVATFLGWKIGRAYIPELDDEAARLLGFQVWILVLIFVGAAIQCYFLELLLNVFTDIRWYLKTGIEVQIEMARMMEERNDHDRRPKETV